MEDDNIDALLVVDAIGLPLRFREWIPASSSLREKADEIFKTREDEELRNLDKLFDYMDKYQKPVIISSQIDEALENSRIFNKLTENGVLIYPTPERAAKVLAHLVSYSRYLSHS